MTLSIETLENLPRIADTIIKVFVETLSSKEPRATERAFVKADRVLNIGRVIEANYLNKILKDQLSTGVARPYHFNQTPTRPLTLGIGSPGLLDSLQFSNDLVYDLPLTRGEVEIEVKATSLNFLDIIVALGQVQGDFLSVKCVGIISRVGPGVKFNVGDRVCALFVGSFKTFC